MNVDVYMSVASYKQKDTTMLMNEFRQTSFRPNNDLQISLLERFLEIRHITGQPRRFAILRNLARTRQHTKSIYPPNWRVQ